MAINANAMYQAGFGSKSTGRNVQVDERNARNAAITKVAFDVLGQAAIGQIKQNYRSLQVYRNASDSHTALLNLKVDKMPASSAEYAIEESQSLKGSVLELKSLYDAAARKASFGIGKGRSKGKQDMVRYMKQLTDMNAILEIHKTKREEAQKMMGVGAGTAGGETASSMSAGSDVFQEGNTMGLANGGIGARLRWNIETGEMEVQVGGDWQTDEQTGLRTYKDKAETGTYEEYVAENQEMNLKLKQKQLASQPEKPEPVMGSRAQVDLAANPIETPYEESEAGKYAKEGLSLTPNPPMSREDWTKLNQENRGAVSTILYKNMKFAVEADGKMAETIRSINSDILKASYKKDAVPWERVSEQYYGELQAKIGEYTDDEFKDYFFGGDTFDHSSGRMTESAPAYQLLLEEDKARGYVNEDGGYKNPELYGPGTPDWESRLLALKGQSFVKGSFYRKEATDRIFKNFENKYIDNAKAYETDYPEETKLANVKINNTIMSGKDYEAAYGSNSKFMLFLNDETELAETEAVEFTSPGGYQYQRKSDGIYQLTGFDDENNKVYGKKVTPDEIKGNEGLVGTSKKTLPIVNKDPADPAVEAGTTNVENFAYDAGGFDGEDTAPLVNIVLDWNEKYKSQGFSFITNKKTGTGLLDGRRKYIEVTITAKNGKKKKIDMGKRGGDSKEDLAKTFNKFIEENKI